MNLGFLQTGIFQSILRTPKIADMGANIICKQLEASLAHGKTAIIENGILYLFQDGTKWKASATEVFGLGKIPGLPKLDISAMFPAEVSSEFTLYILLKENQPFAYMKETKSGVITWQGPAHNKIVEMVETYIAEQQP